MLSPDISEKRQTNQQETEADTIKEEKKKEEVEEVVTSEEVEEAEEAARAKLLNPPGDRKSLYQLADTGLWWDSFEEEPQFELEDDFESQLTLSEGEDWTGLGTKPKEEEKNDHL